MEKTRLTWMDMAKAIGILIVLINHAELNLGLINRFGGMFYMPIFFILAGMTFSVHQGESIVDFAKRKAKRLLKPYLLCNGLLFAFFFVKDSILGGNLSAKSFLPLLGILYSRNQLYRGAGDNIYLMTVQNAPTWFLTCLFLTLVLYALLVKLEEKKGTKTIVGIEIAAFVLAGIYHRFVPVLLPWSMDFVPAAILFLEAGRQLRKHDLLTAFREKRWPIAVLLTLFVVSTYVNGSVNLSVADYGLSMILMMAAAVSGSVLCMETLIYLEEMFGEGKMKALEVIGTETMAILCSHLFIFMLVRTAAAFLPYIGTDGPFLKILMITASICIALVVKKRDKRTVEGCVKAVLWILLFTWFLPIINKGIDVQDTPFYLTNYRYVFDPSVQVNELYYLFAEVLGGLIYHAFPGYELLALNWTCAVVYTLVALLVYRKFRDKMNNYVLLLAILAGSMFAITWVHCINWNAWSVLFAICGAWLLLKAIREKSGLYIFLSGLILGLNAFVRMPNLFFLSLVFVVLWDALLRRDSILTCLPMVAGGALAGVAGVIISLVILRSEKFVEDFSVLLGLGATGDLHSVTTGIYNFLMGVIEGSLSWIPYVLVIAVLCVGKFSCKDVSVRLYKWVTGITIAMCALAGLFAAARENILIVSEMIAVAAFASCAFGTFYFAKKDREFSNLCLTVLILEGFLTIGTDTASIYYRVMIGLPLAMTLCILEKLSGANVRLRVLHGVMAFLLCMALGEAAEYANTYIYHDGTKEECTETVENPVFTGIYTTAERAECLNRLDEQLEPYADHELITIGNFTAAQAITDMMPFFRSSWPDLDYLTDELFEETLDEKTAAGIYPVVVIATEEVNGAYWMPEKVEILKDLVSKEPYTCIYEDHLYSLYVPGR